MIRDDINQGYSQEEAYFYKLNKELLERKRQEPKGFLSGLKKLLGKPVSS